MPTIAEEPELAFNMNELTETSGMAFNAADDTLASAPASSDKRYICPAHPNIDQ